MTNTILSYSIIFIGIFGIAIGSFPRLHLNRTGIALACAVLLLITNSIALDSALKAIDLATIALLLSMMILCSALKLSGFFSFASFKLLSFGKNPLLLLGLVVLVSGFFSALFLNDTMCLILTPLVISMSVKLKANPIPYLLGVACASNVGSMATIIGNPQNMLIGQASGLSFLNFTGHLFIPALVGLVIVWLVIIIVYRKDFFNVNFKIKNEEAESFFVYKPLMIKSSLISFIMLLGFLLGFSTTLCALAAAAFILISRRVKTERFLSFVDWSLLVFFCSLFIITRVIEQSDAFKLLVSASLPFLKDNFFLFSFFSAIISNLISNVPAVMVLKPLISLFADQEKAWLILAMSSTLAGNITLLGSIANLIVVEGAKKSGIKIGFMTYLKVGLPISLLTLFFSTVFLIYS